MYQDPISGDWICSSIFFVLLVVGVYLFMHFLLYKYLPEVDEENNPYYSRWWSPAKNISVALTNAIVGSGLIFTMWSMGYDMKSVICEPVTVTRIEGHSLNITIRKWMLCFMFAKIFECIDTIICTMRGDEFTTWVVFHHTCMVIVSWLAFRFVPGGTSSILASISCCFHVGIYTYLAITFFSDYAGEELGWVPGFLNHVQFACCLGVCFNAATYGCGYPILASGFVGTFIICIVLGWHFEDIFGWFIGEE